MGLQQCTPVTMCMSVNGIFTQPPFCIICCQAYLAHVNCAHSVQDRLDQVLSTEICMKVVESVQIVCKMQVSILHPTFDTLCCLPPHWVDVLEHVVAHLTRTEESVALWTQTNKLLHRRRIQFILEEQQSQLIATWVFYARDSSESCTCAALTSRARRSPQRWVDSV